jgi:hypothetical protein
VSRLYFIDMDGVLCDFIDGVEREFHCNPGSLKATQNYHLHEPLGISYGAFSNRLRTATEEDKFWLGLRPTPWAHELARLFNFRDNAFVLTSPWPGDYQCIAQKVEWCMRYLNIGSDRVITFPHKHILAAPGRVLLDDHPKHCKEWQEAGGAAILFPCTHNATWRPEYPGDPAKLLSFVTQSLKLHA